MSESSIATDLEGQFDSDSLGEPGHAEVGELEQRDERHQVGDDARDDDDARRRATRKRLDRRSLFPAKIAAPFAAALV